MDYDVLICACLLHDIGRTEQFENPKLCHAKEGSKKAYQFLVSNGYKEEYAKKVADCIRVHRYRTDAPPNSLEEKILFDADKLDVTGAHGIARTIFYKGQVGEPLYTRNQQGQIPDGAEDKEPSFFQEYKYKLEGLYDKFYTEKGKELAQERKQIAVAFYESLIGEVRELYAMGQLELEKRVE